MHNFGTMTLQQRGASVSGSYFDAFGNNNGAVHFRHLDEARIERYLAAEQPFDCAGSFKSEGLGVSLFRSTEGEDATSLIGLPLIRLVDMLLAEGVQVP